MRRVIPIVVVPLILSGLLFFLAPQQPACANGRVDVDVEVGPEFTGGDSNRINGCMSLLRSKFPMDFYQVPSGFGVGSNVIPSFEMWGFEYEFPWILGVWNFVEPGFVLVLLYQAIVRL